MMEQLWKRGAMLLLAAGITLGWSISGWTEPAATIANGKQVSIEYTLTLEDKTQIDSNVGKAPLVYTQGSGQIIPGLEKQLVGLKAGDTKRVEVAAKDGYGEVNPERMQEVPKDKVPEGARKVGSKLTGQGPEGQMMFAQVTEVKDETIILDLNHPLAGKKLFFDVTVLKVEDAPQKLEMPPPAAAP